MSHINNPTVGGEHALVDELGLIHMGSTFSRVPELKPDCRVGSSSFSKVNANLQRPAMGGKATFLSWYLVFKGKRVPKKTDATEVWVKKLFSVKAMSNQDIERLLVC